MTRSEVLRFMIACEELIFFVHMKELTLAEKKGLTLYVEELSTLIAAGKGDTQQKQQEGDVNQKFKWAA